MRDPRKEEYPFSNYKNMRGWLDFTLCSPRGAFAQIHFDASPLFQTSFENGPVDASAGISLGMLLESDHKGKKLEKRNSKYFPEYEDLEKKQDEMKESVK
jgi:hypothetical protein